MSTAGKITPFFFLMSSNAKTLTGLVQMERCSIRKAADLTKDQRRGSLISVTILTCLLFVSSPLTNYLETAVQYRYFRRIQWWDILSLMLITSVNIYYTNLFLLKMKIWQYCKRIACLLKLDTLIYILTAAPERFEFWRKPRHDGTNVQIRLYN